MFKPMCGLEEHKHPEACGRNRYTTFTHTSQAKIINHSGAEGTEILCFAAPAASLW